MNKERMITVGVIVAVLVLSITVIYLKKPNTHSGITEELAKCIASNSKIYVQTGCSHCRDQEALFGDYVQLLNSTDCAKDINACSVAGIEYTPTWVINGQKIVGVQTIEKLKTLTNC
jgi:glutaredoxin